MLLLSLLLIVISVIIIVIIIVIILIIIAIIIIIIIFIAKYVHVITIITMNIIIISITIIIIMCIYIYITFDIPMSDVRKSIFTTLLYQGTRRPAALAAGPPGYPPGRRLQTKTPGPSKEFLWDFSGCHLVQLSPKIFQGCSRDFLHI